jgi:hypothetical protein
MALFDVFGLFDRGSRRHQLYVDALLDRVYDDLERDSLREHGTSRPFLVKGPPTETHPWPWPPEEVEKYFKEH